MAITAKDILEIIAETDTTVLATLDEREAADPDYDPIEEMAYTVAKRALDLYASRNGIFLAPPLPAWADLTDDDYPSEG